MLSNKMKNKYNINTFLRGGKTNTGVDYEHVNHILRTLKKKMYTIPVFKIINNV